MTIPAVPVAGTASSVDEAVRRRAVRWRTIIGLALSLTVHALLLLSFREDLELTGDQNEKERAPLIVELGPPSQSSPPSQAAQQALPAQPEVKPPPPAPAARRTPAPSARKPEAPVAHAPQPVRPPAPDAQNAPPADLSAMIAARRAQRTAQAPSTANPEPPASEAAPATQGNEIALENIQRSLKQARGRDGTSGLFRILHKGPRSASFSFRGWSTDSNKRWNQVIEVDAGPNGDVERTIVRKMIELIRQHHLEDFYWDSHRLGRVVKLSARKVDGAGLEEFLMQEFFGNG